MEDDGTWYACAVLVVGLSSAYDRRVKQVRLKYLKHAQFTVDVDESTQHNLTAPPGTHVPLVQKLWKKPPQPNRKRALSSEAEPAPTPEKKGRALASEPTPAPAVAFIRPAPAPEPAAPLAPAPAAALRPAAPLRPAPAPAPAPRPAAPLRPAPAPKPKPAVPLLRPSPALEKPGAIPKKVRSGFAWVPDVLPPRAPPTVPHEVRASGSARAIARAQRMAQMPAPTTPRSPLRPPSNPFELGFQARFVEALSDASTSEGVLVALLTETEGIASLAEHWHAGCAQLRALRMSTLYRDLPCPAGYSLVESRNRPGEYNFADDRGVRAPRGSRARARALRIHPLSCSAPLREG